nr:uncharacterized protein LOC117689484 isoform X1 [Crassostrea gigas]
MVSDWIVIMCLTCAISKYQVSSAKGLERKADDYINSCNAGCCNEDYFLALAPCPPPTKTHLLCDIPLKLTCRERTLILRNCIVDLSQDAISEVFKTCNQSLEVQCEDFFSLCRNVSRFNCGSPQFIKPSSTTVPPQVIYTSTPSYDVTNSYMNDSGLDVGVTGGRPELPVLNAGSGDRNWWPLLSLLTVPLLVAAICFVYCARKRRNSGSLEISNKDDEAMEKNLLEAEMQPKKERETYKSQDDLFRKIPYIDEDVLVDDTSEFESCVDDLTNDVIDMKQY